MRTKRIAALVTGLLLPASLALARGFSAEDKKLIDESVTALRGVDADLSARLQRFAAEKRDKKEGDKSKMTPEAKAEKIRLLRDSAAALRGTRADLADRLEMFADKKEKAHREDMPRESGASPREPDTSPRESGTSPY